MFYLTVSATKKVLCHATDWSLSTSTEEVEITGPGSGAWREFIPGLNSYTLNVPGVIAFTDDMNAVQLSDMQNARQIVEWTAGMQPDGGLQYHGFMFITSLSINSQVRDAMRFDMSARGTGPEDVLKLPITKSVYLADRQNVRLAGCPNPYPVGVLWYDGTLIGPAADADDVISIFNAYSITQGGFLTLLTYSSGCDFTMQVAWNSPLNPDVVYAVEGGAFALRGTMPNEAIGGQDNTNEVISA